MALVSITKTIFVVCLGCNVKTLARQQLVRGCGTYLYGRDMELFIFDGAAPRVQEGIWSQER
jgi:hypothetical protein